MFGLLKNLMLFLKGWSSFSVVVLWTLSIMGCDAGVLLHPQGKGGGIVQYLYQEHNGQLLSPNRSEALQQMTRYCVGPYNIVKEGPTRGRKRMIEGVAGTDVVRENWWGIRFECQLQSTDKE